MFPRTEMLDLIVVDGRARGIVTRNLITDSCDPKLERVPRKEMLNETE